MPENYKQNAADIVQIITAGGLNFWNNLLSTLENTGALDDKTKLVMSAIIRNHFLGSERRFATLEAAISGFLDFLETGQFSDYGFDEQFLDFTMDDIRITLRNAFINRIINRGDAAIAVASALTSSTDNFQPPATYGYGYDEPGTSYGYGYTYNYLDYYIILQEI